MQSIVFNEQRANPSKIVCIGRNYLNHIKELNNETPKEPVLFIKPNSAISDILSISKERILHYEAELCLLIREQKITGIAMGLDLTDRKLQSTLKQKGLPWEKAKAFDGSAVFSNFIALKNGWSLSNLSFTLSVNNVIKQHGFYHDMIYKPQLLLEHIQTYFTLLDNDIVMTGTPEGVGEVVLDDVLEVTLYLKDKVILTKKWLAIAV